MHSGRRCAVVASAFLPDRERMAALLNAAGFSEMIHAEDGLTALNAVRSRRPDALIADAVLPVMDGVTLAGRIGAEPLTVYPSVVIAAVPGMRTGPLPEGCAKVDKPISLDALCGALLQTHPVRRAVPAQKLERAQEFLDAVGIPEHPGRIYLLWAALLSWMDGRYLHGLTTRLYPAVAEKYSVERRHVERAMRHVIDVAWKNGEIEAQHNLFGDTIDAGRGSPTCGEMIARIADILRWEGRA